MELQLNLKKHCIATECKKIYNKSVSQYLKKIQGKSDLDEKSIENTIELLKTALEKLDFPGLRSKYSELAGKSDSIVILGINSNHELFIAIDNQNIELLFLQ